MRNRPTGRKLDSPVPSRAVIGASACSSQSWALDPYTTPAAARPTMPRKTRRPTGVPFGLGSTSAARAIQRTYGAGALTDGQLPAIDLLGRQFGGDSLRDSREGLGRFAVGFGCHDRAS